MGKSNKSWFRRHWILTSLFVIVLLFIVSAIIGSNSENSIENYDNSEGNTLPQLITTQTQLLLPAEWDIDREWQLRPVESVSFSNPGFEEGSRLEIFKTDSFTTTTIRMEAYRFDSLENADSLYNGKVQEIDVRGVEEIDLGEGCFGIDREIGLSGKAEAYCLRKNVVIYISSTSNSFMYASDLEDFLDVILKNL